MDGNWRQFPVTWPYFAPAYSPFVYGWPVPVPVPYPAPFVPYHPHCCHHHHGWWR